VRRPLGACSLWAAFVAWPVAVAAQGPSPTIGTTPRTCFRGRPLPHCGSFWIAEYQGDAPFGHGEWATMEWNLGGMRNVTSAFAFGGSLTLGWGNTHPITGARLRARRWLREDVSAELGAGLVHTHGSETPFPMAATGSVDARINLGDQGSLFLRWDAGPQHGVSWGAGLGSTLAVVATGVMAVAVAMAVVAFLAGGTS
jgi:hypothetical protein